MLDLPPELIDQILYYLTNPEVKTCLESHPCFEVLTKRREHETIIKGTPLYHAYIATNYSDIPYHSLGVYMDYRQAIEVLVRKTISSYSTKFYGSDLQRFIQRDLIYDDPNDLDSFGQYLLKTPLENINEASVVDELLKLIDMSSWARADYDLERKVLYRWVHEFSNQWTPEIACIIVE